MMKTGLEKDLPRVVVRVSCSEAGAFQTPLPKASAPGFRFRPGLLGPWEQHTVSKSLCSFCDS